MSGFFVFLFDLTQSRETLHIGICLCGHEVQTRVSGVPLPLFIFRKIN